MHEKTCVIPILKHLDFVTTNWMEYFINSKWASDLLFLAVSNQWLKRCICLANEYSLNIGKDGWLRKLWQFFTQIGPVKQDGQFYSESMSSSLSGMAIEN